MIEVLGLVFAFAVCGGLLFLATRIEPHWVSKDGERFTCMGQHMTPRGEPLGRWREMRAIVTHDRSVMITKRSLLRGGRTGRWHLQARSESPSRGKAIYLLDGNPDEEGLLALRVPAKSKCVPILDGRLASPSGRGSVLGDVVEEA